MQIGAGELNHIATNAKAGQQGLNRREIYSKQQQLGLRLENSGQLSGQEFILLQVNASGSTEVCL